jgi:hypothetical protein
MVPYSRIGRKIRYTKEGLDAFLSSARVNEPEKEIFM